MHTHCSEMGWYQTGYQLLGLYQKLLRCTGFAFQWCRLVADHTNRKAGCLLPAHFRTMALCIPIARKWVDTKQIISCLGCIRSCYGVLALRFSGSRIVAVTGKKAACSQPIFPGNGSVQTHCSEMGWYQTGYQLLGLYQKLLRCTGFAFQW